MTWNESSHRRNGLLAGAIVALALSIYTSLSFRLGVMGVPGYVAWNLVSILVGGGAGFFGGLIVDEIPVRLIPIVGYLVGLVCGALCFALQLYTLLVILLARNPGSF